MPLEFTPSAGASVGVELELQILDPGTLDLTPAAPRLLERLAGDSRVKPEIFQSMLEVCTGVCANAAEAKRDLAATLGKLHEACREEGVRLASAGSHPFAVHRERLLYPAERYVELVDRNRWIARRLMIFGLHVHLGMRDGPRAWQVLNGLLAYLPHLLACSASSPFWQGSDTGLASSRITIFEALPTAGHPCTFADWDAFVRFCDALVASRAIRSIKDIWWDIRPHPDYGTVEIRICDEPPTLREIGAVVALAHALGSWLDARAESGERFLPPADWIIRENKWRASRWGLEAEFVADETGRTVPAREAIEQLVEELEPVARGQGAAEELAGVVPMLARPSYVRQREVMEREANLVAVARSVADEFGVGERPEAKGQK